MLLNYLKIALSTTLRSLEIVLNSAFAIFKQSLFYSTGIELFHFGRTNQLINAVEDVQNIIKMLIVKLN